MIRLPHSGWPRPGGAHHRRGLRPHRALLHLFVLFLGLSCLEAQEGRALEPYVDELLRERGVDSVSELDADALPPEVLEELGFRVMGRMVDDPEWHRWMNSMMGGEGSEELAEFHRGLGESFIEREGELPEWERGFGGPGMMARHQRRWFMPPRLHIPPPILLLLVIAGITTAVVVTLMVIRRRDRDN